ncbi:MULTISPECIES: DUF7563 family protein [Salinibaculum]|uniref:DUF7563 family protein n=1 Tax=Salinibaculum TaxID=2732368 RepID=UPI0030D22DE4
MATHDHTRESASHATNQCNNCNTYVTQQFARVFGDNDNTVHACIECSTLHALREGEGGARN